MAKFLFLASDVAGGGYLEDDPIAVYEDGKDFGYQEDIRVHEAKFGNTDNFEGLFYIIEIPGMPKTIGERLLQQWRVPASQSDPEFDAPDAVDRYVYLGPNRWRMGKQDRFPPALSSKLRRDYFLVLPYDVPTINNYVVDRMGLDVFITDNPIDP